jgi:hypothetical protein
MSLTSTTEYKALQAHVEELKKTNMREMFDQDSNRFSEFR